MKNEKIKWIATGLAVVLLTAACATSLAMGIKNNGWFKKDEDKTAELPVENNGNGGVLLPSESNGIRLMSARIAPETYAENGIDPQADSAFKLTATVTDANGNTPSEIQKVSYSLAWKSGTPGTLSDFVTMTTSGTTATFTCKKAFSTQIVVTCTSDLDSTKKATATLDYYKRVTSMKGSIDSTTTFSNGTVATYNAGSSYEDWDECYLDLVHNTSSDFNYGTGTVNSTISRVNYTISLSSAFQNALKAKAPSLNFTFTSETGTGGYNQDTGIGSLPYVFNKMIHTTSGGNMSNWFYYFNNAIAQTTNQMTVKMDLTTSYGTETIQYTINFTGVTAMSIGNVSTDKTGLIF